MQGPANKGMLVLAPYSKALEVHVASIEGGASYSKY